MGYDFTHDLIGWWFLYSYGGPGGGFFSLSSSSGLPLLLLSLKPLPGPPKPPPGPPKPPPVNPPSVENYDPTTIIPIFTINFQKFPENVREKS